MNPDCGCSQFVHRCSVHAAAPDLLAALSRVKERMDTNEVIGFSVDDYEAVEAAIRKAEGQEVTR